MSDFYGIYGLPLNCNIFLCAMSKYLQSPRTLIFVWIHTICLIRFRNRRSISFVVYTRWLRITCSPIMYGDTPFPRKNNATWKVSLSPIHLLRKIIILMFLGHWRKGAIRSPFKLRINACLMSNIWVPQYFILLQCTNFLPTGQQGKFQFCRHFVSKKDIHGQRKRKFWFLTKFSILSNSCKYAIKNLATFLWPLIKTPLIETSYWTKNRIVPFIGQTPNNNEMTVAYFLLLPISIQ